VNTLTKITLLLLVLTTLTALPMELRADGNPIPICNGKVCIP
jgi:hypothetical protein